MELDFVRSGGFAGPATQVEGKVSMAGTSGEVTSANGYSRKLSVDETTKLQAMATAAVKQKAAANGPGDLRDGFQYDVTFTGADGTKQSVVTHGETDVTGIFSWVRTECDKIWKFRTGS